MYRQMSLIAATTTRTTVTTMKNEDIRANQAQQGR
jgi:hypothetical protein